MEKAKPIEPGCLALVIAAPVYPPAIGQIVRIREQRISAPFAGYWISDYSPNGGIWCHAEENLLRIDDPDIQTQIDRERVLEHV